MKLSILDYVYGELDASQRADFERALKGDEELQKELQEVRQQLAMVRDAQSVITMPKLSKSASERILAYAREQAETFSTPARSETKSLASFFDFSLFWRRPALAFAFTVCMTAGAVFWVAQERLNREAAFRPSSAPVSQTTVASEISAVEAPAPTQNKLNAQRADRGRRATQPPPQRIVLANKSAPAPVALGGVSAEQDSQSGRAEAASDFAKAEAESAPPPASAPVTPPAAQMERRKESVQNRPMNTLAYRSGAGLSTVGDGLDSQSVRLQFDMAERLYAARRFPEALARYQRVAQLAYGSTEGIAAYHQAARIYSSEMQNPQKALQLYEIILSRWPDYLNLDKVLLEAGTLYEKSEDWEHAYELFKRAYDDFPAVRSQVEPHLQTVSTHVKPAL